MVCFFLVVLGAKIGVVVCLVGAFLVVLAQFEMSLHHLISENNSCISYAATKIDCDPGETIVNQDIEHRIQRQ